MATTTTTTTMEHKMRGTKFNMFVTTLYLNSLVEMLFCEVGVIVY